MNPSLIGSKIDKLFQIREKKQQLQDQIKELNAEFETIEKDLVSTLEAQGLDKARGNLATASIAPMIVPTVKDKEEMAKWAYENDRFDILQARISRGPAVELYTEENFIVPGTDVFTKTKLSITKKRGG